MAAASGGSGRLRGQFQTLRARGRYVSAFQKSGAGCAFFVKIRPVLVLRWVFGRAFLPDSAAGPAAGKKKGPCFRKSLTAVMRIFS